MTRSSRHKPSRDREGAVVKTRQSRHVTPLPDGRGSVPARAFTLLEVLIAFLLATTLLLGLWGIMGIYSRLFESGKAKTEQSQLARALLEQLADDLRSTIQDAPAEGQLAGAAAPAGSDAQTAGASSGFETPTAVRRFGLFGSAHAMTFDVLQVTPEQAVPPAEDATSPNADVPALGRAPELRTVQYTFVEPEVSTEKDVSAAVEVQSDRDKDRVEARPGLTRRELDFEPPKERRADSKFDRTIAKATAEAAGRRDGDLDDPGSEDRPDDPSITWVPEVVGLSLRYFDGRGWSSTWDSLQRKSLPVAVEARIEIESFDPRDRRRRLAEQETLDDEVTVVGAEGPDPLETDRPKAAGAAAVRDDGRRVYRLVIDLPTATSYRGVQAASSRSALPAARSIVPRPLPTPSLRVPRTKSEAKPATRPSDQWMRTNSP
ncbi:MAG: hypothetical protein NTW96_19915 [Planctomycetia bacterium]|nr:hypothetical protein [Planctomycetia bacterium]